jgi:hypothetical protein
MMFSDEDWKQFNLCQALIDDGKYIDSIKEVEKISFDGFKAAIYIDAGKELDDIQKVRKGTKNFIRILENSDEDYPIPLSQIYYNAANGYDALYKLKEKAGKADSPPNDTDLRNAKRYYREAIRLIKPSDYEFLSRAEINYASCLSKFGRCFDAIDHYQKAYQIDNRNGMSAGNLGIELEHAARMMGSYFHQYIELAYQYIKQSLSPDMHLNDGTPSAKENFLIRLNYLEKFIQAHDPSELGKLISLSNIDDEYILFCLDNELFLNAWAGDRSLLPAITDDLVFGNITTDIDDHYLVPELLRILNEIKESYATARYIFFLSERDTEGLNQTSKLTTYFDVYDYSIHGLYAGFCKAAYSRAFDILDKVARLINIYFKIGKRNDSFWNLFAVKQSQGQEQIIRFIARPEICQFKNFSLFALSDLCIDYFESEHVDLKTINHRRNMITHDFLNVKEYKSEEEQDNIISIYELYRQTKEVLLLAKRATLYAVSAINISEMEKYDPSQQTASMIYGKKQGDIFIE